VPDRSGPSGNDRVPVLSVMVGVGMLSFTIC